MGISFTLERTFSRYENLFQAPQGDAMILFMWQDDIIGVARFIDACLERSLECPHQLALPWGTRHLISPELAGKGVMILLLLQAFQTDMMNVNMTIITMLGRAPFNEAFHTSRSALGYAFMLASSISMAPIVLEYQAPCPPPPPPLPPSRSHFGCSRQHHLPLPGRLSAAGASSIIYGWYAVL